MTLREQVSEICLALPEASREDYGRHSGFIVRNKKFAYFLDDHHGDGMVAVSCRLPRGENAQLVEFAPDRYYLPAYTAHRGWVALRLDLGAVDWEEVATLVRDSYRLQAPKRLVALLG